MPIFKEMKKSLFFTAALVATLVTLSSCDIIDIRNDKPSDKVTAPQAKNSATGTQLTISSVTGAEYLNIFRYTTANQRNDSPVNKDSLTNIGEIYIHNSNVTAFSFEDRYTDSGKYYKYEIRYKTANGYTFSELSASTVKGIRSGTDAERPITPGPDYERITASLDSNQYVISIPYSSVVLPDPAVSAANGSAAKFNLMIAISNASVTNLFKMTEDPGNDKYSISLRSNLPAHFYDRTLTVSKLIGQYTENVSVTGQTSADYECVYWTKPIDVTLKQNGTDNNKFEIKSVIDSYTIMDYTPQANASVKKATADLPADTIYCDYN